MSAASTPSTPGWLLQGELGLCPCGCIGRRKKGSFVEKTISGAASLVHRAMFADHTAAQEGLLQRLEPRVKLVSLLLLLVAAGLARSLPVLAALYVLTLLIALASGLSLAFFVKRVWLFIPIFTGIVVLPATLSVITPGEIVIPLGHWWFGQEIGITRPGLMGAGLIVSRVAVSISLVVLLTLTTQWSRLLAALRALLVPRMFVLVLAMCYRYIFHLLGSVTDMYTARKARTVGPRRDTGSGRAFVAASAGALFGKASALSDEVHLAMISRGYTGEVRTFGRRRVRAADVAWGLLAAVLALATIGADRVLAR